MDDLFSVSTSETKKKEEKGNIKNDINNKKNNSFNKREDIFSNDFNFENKNQKIKKNKKKKNINIYFIVFIMFVLLSAAIYFTFIKKRSFSAKEYILESIKKADFSKNLRLEDFKNFTNKLNSKAYEITSSGKIDPKFMTKDKDEEKEGKDKKQKNKTEDKLKIKDLDFVFKGSVNNKEDNKESLINTNIIWNKTNITSWNIYENKDIILIEAPEYFKEMISIKKDSLDKIFTSDSSILETYKNINMSQDENIFEEMIMIKEDIKKSFLKSLENMSKQNFKVEKKIPTTYREEKVNSDNYKIVLDNISLNVIMDNILKDVDTALKVDASRYKILGKNEASLKNLIKKLKPEMRDTDKLEIVFYKIKGNVPKIEISIKPIQGNSTKIFQMEIKEEKKKDFFEIISIFGKTKMKVTKEKERERYKYNVDFETLKNNITNIKPNEIKIENEKTKEKNKDNENGNVSNISKSNIKKIDFLSQVEENTENTNEENKENKENKENPNKNNINEENVVEEKKTEGIDNIINAKEEDKVFFKFEFSIPENIYANNMRLDTNIYSNMLDLNLAINVEFKEILEMEMMQGERIELDKMSSSARKAMYKNLIEPTIVSVTAKKLDEISKQKQAIENSNKKEEKDKTEHIQIQENEVKESDKKEDENK